MANLSVGKTRIVTTSLQGNTNEDLCIEAQERGKNFVLIIKSSLCEGIFISSLCRIKRYKLCWFGDCACKKNISYNYL